ncbi:MAG: hypothetical protein JW818_07585 [Pirellulales bacterium]|nr:hypothetical protein [Pirellulales bacterium]
MQRVLFEYSLDPTTWVYLSSLVTIGIYFKFRRFWSVRNVDLIGLIAFAPGLLLVGHGQEHLGYVWLLIVGAAYLVRLLLDPVMVRRPLLEPNLSVDGLVFAGVALLIFLSANVVTGKLTESDRDVARRMDMLLAGEITLDELGDSAPRSPGYPLFHVFATFSNTALVPDAQAEAPPLPRRALVRAVVTRATVIFAHFAIVLGIVLIGYRHFDNLQTGLAAAVLYLLLPYTNEMISRVDHVLPAAMLVWAIEAYRRPMVAGVLLGLAAGMIFYPWFLVPLWCSFYWRRGLIRFLGGVVVAVLVLGLSLIAIPHKDTAALMTHVQALLGAGVFSLEQPVDGFWRFYNPVFRIPVAAAFVVVSLLMVLWPAQKNLGTLLSCSAALMLGVTFWYDPGGGVYHMAWFLPLLLLTIFRPNLEDRIAMSAVSAGWFSRPATSKA